MIARAASLAAVCLATFAAEPASAIVWCFSLKDPEQGHQDFWPIGLKEAVRLPGYIGGEHFVAPGWGSGHESTTLHYRGDAESLNGLLEEYAKLDAPRLTVTIHPGVPELYDTANTRISRDGNPPALKSYDWALAVNASLDPERKRQGGDLGPDAWNVQVHVSVWTGGNVELDDLHVPAGMSVKAGGDIGAFINRYEAEEARRRKREEPADDRPSRRDGFDIDLPQLVPAASPR